MEDICHIDDIPAITITNSDQVTLTYFDPKDPGCDVHRLLSLLDSEHYEVIRFFTRMRYLLSLNPSTVV